MDSVMAAGGEFPDFEHKRLETISRLWNITETLNVLYRENWTVMANVEIIKFQNEMIQSIREEMREAGPGDIRAATRQVKYKVICRVSLLDCLSICTCIKIKSPEEFIIEN